MNQDIGNFNRFSEVSNQSSTFLDDQIQPFEIQANTLTHFQVSKLIQKWDTFIRIQQKFNIWGFTFEFKQILKLAPQTFYKSAIHYVCLKKLKILIKQYDESQILKQSLQVKAIYKQLTVAGKLKGKKFDFLLLTCVKLIGFFFGSHTRQIIINHQLECEIYSILIYVLLGTEVGEKAFQVVQDKYKKKQNDLKYSRKATGKLTLIAMQSKKSSQHKQKQKKIKSTAMSKKRIGRCEFKSGSALFHQLPEADQDQNYRQMKQLLKANLLVKQFISKPKTKQTLDQVVLKVHKSEQRFKQLQNALKQQKKEMKHKKICYTQMSSSLDLLRNSQSLNILKNHSMTFKPQKCSKYYQMIKREDLKFMLTEKKVQQKNKLPKIQNLRQPEIYSYQAMLSKKRQANYWKQILGQMKQNKYQNIQHFPPISAKMYFKNGQFQDQNKNSRTIQIRTEGLSQSYHNANTEFITQKSQTYRTTKQCATEYVLKDNPSTKRTQKAAKTSLRANALLQQLKNQINIIEYTTFTNQNQIFKAKNGSLNIYSTQPLNDENNKIKKISHHRLKQYEKRFEEQCKQREQNIQKSQFSLPYVL